MLLADEVTRRDRQAATLRAARGARRARPDHGPRGLGRHHRHRAGPRRGPPPALGALRTPTSCSNGCAPPRLDGTYDEELRKLHRVELLILDDLALHPLGTTETSDFYELVVERHRHHSTITTSNRDPAEMVTMMADPLLAQSAIDRLQSAAFELVVEGQSYRQRQKPVPAGGEAAAASDGHEERFAGAVNLRTAPERPLHVGGDQADVEGPQYPADRRGEQRRAQRRDEALGGDLPGRAEWAADVLVVDQSVGQPDRPAGGEPGRGQVLLEQCQQLGGGAAGVLGHPDRVGPVGQEPSRAIREASWVALSSS